MFKLSVPLRGHMIALAITMAGSVCGHASAQTVVPLEGTYTGSVNNGGTCSTTYRFSGFKPAQAGNKPLFLYFVGTDVAGNVPAAYQGPAPRAVTQAMAQRGYAAVSVQYDNSLGTLLSDQANMRKCLFDQTNPSNLLAALCKPSMGIDCNLGIATWGHSLGGAVALVAANYDRRVRAAWATGVNGVGDSVLPKTRIRIVNGSADSTPLIGWIIGNNNDAARLSTQMGVTASDCPFQFNQCLRPNGSGWMLVQSVELSPWRSADHCWFEKSKCTDQAMRLEPNFAANGWRISIAANADWLVSAASTPW